MNQDAALLLKPLTFLFAAPCTYTVRQASAITVLLSAYLGKKKIEGKKVRSRKRAVASVTR